MPKRRVGLQYRYPLRGSSMATGKEVEADVFAEEKGWVSVEVSPK
jgi:hypothetical protein